MDADRFETLLRSVSSSGNRRRVLAALVGATLGLRGLAAAEARKKGKKKKKKKPCGPDTCAGCCDGGRCVPGTTFDACGGGGAVCEICGPDFACINRRCQVSCVGELGVCDEGRCCDQDSGLCKAGNENRACSSGGPDQECVDCLALDPWMLCGPQGCCFAEGAECPCADSGGCPDCEDEECPECEGDECSDCEGDECPPSCPTQSGDCAQCCSGRCENGMCTRDCRIQGCPNTEQFFCCQATGECHWKGFVNCRRTCNLPGLPPGSGHNPPHLYDCDPDTATCCRDEDGCIYCHKAGEPCPSWTTPDSPVVCPD